MLLNKHGLTAENCRQATSIIIEDLNLQKKFHTVDFAIISLATAYKKDGDKVEDVRMVLGGVAPVPVRLSEAEELIKGKVVTPELIEEALEISFKNCNLLRKNKPKYIQAKTYVKRFLESI